MPVHPKPKEATALYADRQAFHDRHAALSGWLQGLIGYNREDQ